MLKRSTSYYTGWSKKKFMIMSVAYIYLKIDFSLSYSLSVYLNTQFVLSKLFFHAAEKALHVSKKSQKP